MSYHPDLRPGEVLGCDHCGAKPLLDGTVPHQAVCAALAERVFPTCDDGPVRGEGTACGERAFYRVGNCFYCTAHREQGRVFARPIDVGVWFGDRESMRFSEMLSVLGLGEVTT